MSALPYESRHKLTLTITSLLSILLLSFHLSDDIIRGMEPGGIKNIIGVLILVVWLYGTLVLAERRSGYVIGFAPLLDPLGTRTVEPSAEQPQRSRGRAAGRPQRSTGRR